MNLPRLFIGSSVEALPVARALQVVLDHDFEITGWTQNVFEPGEMTLTDLVKQISSTDFAVLILGPDDQVIRRQEVHAVTRDNVVFELGYAMGALGYERVFMISPRGVDMHLPSDLAGVTRIGYNSNRSDDNLQAALDPAGTQILNKARRLGPRVRDKVSTANPLGEFASLNHALVADRLARGQSRFRNGLRGGGWRYFESEEFLDTLTMADGLHNILSPDEKSFLLRGSIFRGIGELQWVTDLDEKAAGEAVMYWLDKRFRRPRYRSALILQYLKQAKLHEQVHKKLSDAREVVPHATELADAIAHKTVRNFIADPSLSIDLDDEDKEARRARRELLELADDLRDLFH